MPENLQLAEAYVDITLRDEDLNAALSDLRSRMAAAPLEVPVTIAPNAAEIMRDQLAMEMPTTRLHAASEGMDEFGESALGAAGKLRVLGGILGVIDPQLGAAVRGLSMGARAANMLGSATGSAGAGITGLVANLGPLALVAVAIGLCVYAVKEWIDYYQRLEQAQRSQAQAAHDAIMKELDAQEEAAAKEMELIEKLQKKRKEKIAELQHEESQIPFSLRPRGRLQSAYLAAQERAYQIEHDTSSGMGLEERKRAAALYMAKYVAELDRQNAEDKAEEAKKAAEEERQRQEKVYAAMQESRRRMDEETKEAKRRDRALELLEQGEQDKAQDRRLEKDARARSEAAEALRVGLVGGAQEMWAQIQGGPAEQAAKAAEEANRIARESVELEKQIRDNTAKRKEILGE